MKLYAVKPDYLYGSDKDACRAKQVAALETVGVKECTEGFAVCDAEKALQLAAMGYCGSYITTDKISELVDINADNSAQELISASVAASIKAVGDLFNERTQQEQPGPLLMGVTETMLMEDACTDGLQEKLHNGWRILAVCPQPQRRPDYVLGRAFADRG